MNFPAGRQFAIQLQARSQREDGDQRAVGEPSADQKMTTRTEQRQRAPEYGRSEPAVPLRREATETRAPSL
ncbi:hypothetical protein [Salinicola halimionae]|uniref:hypothetical protein n=1 Tax=Salinicola halimionae TaxID=1949081 RepID=UPI000DA23461|nr:hypothetical protein [Salinicola halimionae]